MVMHKSSAYYASIMLNAFRHLLCSLLCQHNRRVPTVNARSNFFTQRIINSWNSLPQGVVSAYTIASFKSELDDYWSSSGYGYERRFTA